MKNMLTVECLPAKIGGEEVGDAEDGRPRGWVRQRLPPPFERQSSDVLP